MKIFFFNLLLSMNTKLSKVFNYAWKTAFVFLSIVFFPLGLFLLGYVLGSNRNKYKLKEKPTNEAVLEEIVKEPKEESEDKVVI